MRSQVAVVVIAVIGLAFIELKYIPFLRPRNDDISDLFSNIGTIVYFPALFFFAGVRRLVQVSHEQSGLVYSGLWFRFVAGLLDFFAVTLVVTCGTRSIIDVMRTTGSHPDMSRRVADLGSTWQQTGFMFIFFGIYYVLMETSRFEASLGKLALRMRVTDMEGRRISVARSALRYLGKIVSLGTFLIGFLVGIFTSRKQTLHDLLAKTVVVDA